VAPGPIWTPLIPSTMPPKKVEEFGGDTPLGRAGQPAELAPVYVMLASDEWQQLGNPRASRPDWRCTGTFGRNANWACWRPGRPEEPAGLPRYLPAAHTEGRPTPRRHTSRRDPSACHKEVTVSPPCPHGIRRPRRARHECPRQARGSPAKPADLGPPNNPV
jgi:hypothetical protein